jgi:carboxymethylenebutenolidase
MNGMMQIGMEHGTEHATEHATEQATEHSPAMGSVEVYRSEPDATAGPIKGAVIVVHEVWGLVDQIKDVADRFAAEGYLVLAPDLLAVLELPSGEIEELQRAAFNPDQEARTRVQPRLRELLTPLGSPELSARALAQLKSCVDALLAEQGINGRIAIVGFCFGGTQAYTLAVHEPRLRAAVAFYGHAQYSVAELAGIRCPIQAFYGENDARLIDALPDFRGQLREAGVDFRAEIFPDCGHAFFNDANPFAYNTDAAARAWQISREFLAETLNDETLNDETLNAETLNAETLNAETQNES